MTITPEQLDAFRRTLQQEERSPGTIDNYLRHVRAFAAWLAERALSRENVQAWKETLLAKGLAPASINGKLVALNRLLGFLQMNHLRVRLLRVQRRLFCDDSRELSRADYERLLAAARQSGKERLALVMETLCACAFVSANCATSPLKPPPKATQPSPSKAKPASFSCHAPFAKNSAASHKKIKPFPACSFAPETVVPFRVNKSGQK